MTNRRPGLALLLPLLVLAGLSLLGCAILIPWEPADLRIDLYFDNSPTPGRLSSPTPRPAASRSATAFPAASPIPTSVFNPITWDELNQFLARDHTNWNEYLVGEYVCMEFAVDLALNASREGIKSWIVVVEFLGSSEAHAFVGFETSDHGLVYIEPQTDNPYWHMQVGDPLCDSWGMYECFGTVSDFEYLLCSGSMDCVPYTP